MWSGLALKPEIKRQWLKDLRSRKFAKGLGHLKLVENNKVSYCCIGVFCERLGAPHWLETLDGNEGVGTYMFDFDGVHNFALPPPEWMMQFFDHNKTVNPRQSAVAAIEALMGKLATMNDGGIMSFREIADWIDTNL